MNLYDDLRNKVHTAGFTMTEVCQRAGVSTGTPSHWKAGRVLANQRTYDKLLSALREMVAERNDRMRAAGIL